MPYLGREQCRNLGMKNSQSFLLLLFLLLPTIDCHFNLGCLYINIPRKVRRSSGILIASFRDATLDAAATGSRFHCDALNDLMCKFM